MNKIIFQVGLLAFFVSIVIFGSQSLPLIEIVARSFIVFIGAVVTAILAIALGTMLMKDERHEEPADRLPLTKEREQIHRHSQTAATGKSA